MLVAGVFGIVAVEVLVDIFCAAAGLLVAAGSILGVIPGGGAAAGTGEDKDDEGDKNDGGGHGGASYSFVLHFLILIAFLLGYSALYIPF